jgi:hypothetical protein
MYMGLFTEYFVDPIAYLGDRGGHLKHVWVDNSSSHNRSLQLQLQLQHVLDNKNIKLCYLLACSTSLAQPIDQLIIAKIKDAWTRWWEMKKEESICTDQWQNDPLGRRGWFGKLKNPDKPFFFTLAVDIVRDVSHEWDHYGMTYARKAMIRCGMSLDVDGVWRCEQLFPHLQEIIAEHPNQFRGEPVLEVLLWEEE